MLDLLAANALLVLAIMTVLWLASLRLRDVSIVDPWWSILFLATTARTATSTTLGPRKVALLALVALWALRLFAHLFRRSLGKSEDPRYAAFRARYGARRYGWVSFFQVFVLQGALAFVISAPLVYAASRPPDEPFHLLDILGFALFVLGFAFEAVADRQLQRFRDDPQLRGRVLDTGLFAYTRHPNYFGDASVWWGIWLVGGLGSGWIAGAATVIAPLTMTWFLMETTGAKLLEKTMMQRPGYPEYAARTSKFLPLPPKNA